MNRRIAFSAIAGGALTGVPLFAQTQKKPARPVICMHSANMAKIPYQELSGFVKELGYDGVDLTVMPGGHVDPAKYMVDLDRAMQSFQSDGMTVPMVTTAFTSPTEPYAYAVFYVSGQLGAQFCRLGRFPVLQDSPAPMASALPVRNALAQFANMARQGKVIPLLTNRAGAFPGRAIPETEALLAGLPDDAFQYCFDPAESVFQAHNEKGWEDALRAALPRLGAVSLADVTLDGAGRTCPLGEGVIDWKKFFTTLAAARFHGPISIRMDYKPENEISAMGKDLAFVRRWVADAWGGA